MPVYARAAVIAVALVVMVGAGLAFFNNRAPGGVGAAPTATPTPEPSNVAPGITGWVPYTSAVYGFTLSYPEGWEVGPAVGEWQRGDAPADFSTEDAFVAPSADDLYIGAFQVSAGKGADVESVSGLTLWAEKFCNDTGGDDCDTLAERVVPMCLDAGGDPCRPAILVLSEGANPDGTERVYVPDWPSATDTSIPDKVNVIGSGRGDEWPGAAKYGGTVELLKSIVSTMGVTEAP